AIPPAHHAHPDCPEPKSPRQHCPASRGNGPQSVEICFFLFLPALPGRLFVLPPIHPGKRASIRPTECVCLISQRVLFRADVGLHTAVRWPNIRSLHSVPPDASAPGSAALGSG